MAKGTLYLYFKNKDELTNTLVKWIFQQLEQEFIPQNEIQTLADYMAQLQWLLDTPVDARRDTRLFFEVLGPGFGTPEVTAEIAAFFERIAAKNAALLEQLILAGEVGRSNPHYSAD